MIHCRHKIKAFRSTPFYLKKIFLTIFTLDFLLSFLHKIRLLLFTAYFLLVSGSESVPGRLLKQDQMSIRSYFKKKETTTEVSGASDVVSLKRTRAGTSSNNETIDEESKNPSKRTKIQEPTSKVEGSPKSPAKEKRVKTDIVSDEGGKANPSEESKALAPEIQERIKRNKEQALEKRRALESKGEGKQVTTVLEAAGQLPSSWKEVLSAEVSKPYFKSLNEFVR